MKDITLYNINVHSNSHVGGGELHYVHRRLKIL